jgi:hypothetical protein
MRQPSGSGKADFDGADVGLVGATASCAQPSQDVPGRAGEISGFGLGKLRRGRDAARTSGLKVAGFPAFAGGVPLALLALTS